MKNNSKFHRQIYKIAHINIQKKKTSPAPSHVVDAVALGNGEVENNQKIAK